ncbi:hypothetical protein GWI33_009571, partial [Rhynchophorus ferrugineus]
VLEPESNERFIIHGKTPRKEKSTSYATPDAGAIPKPGRSVRVYPPNLNADIQVPAGCAERLVQINVKAAGSKNKAPYCRKDGDARDDCQLDDRHKMVRSTGVLAPSREKEWRRLDADDVKNHQREHVQEPTGEAKTVLLDEEKGRSFETDKVIKCMIFFRLEQSFFRRFCCR